MTLGVMVSGRSAVAHLGGKDETGVLVTMKQLAKQPGGSTKPTRRLIVGSTRSLFDKAAKSDADVIFLDCEDAVAPDDKVDARKNIVKGLSEVDWNKKTMMVRINGLDTHYMYRDVIDIVETCPRLDMILIPKVGTAEDVYAVDMLVTQIEDATGRTTC